MSPLVPRTLLLALIAVAATPAHAAPAPWTTPPRYKGPSRTYTIVLKRNVNNNVPADCPTLTGWTGEKLFPTAKFPQLQQFCRYTASGAPTKSPPSDSNFAAASADYDVLVPQNATSLAADPAVRAALATAFRKELGIVPSGKRQTIYQTPANLPRVAVIDTVPAGQSVTHYDSATPRAQHGLAMAQIIRDVRCPNGESNCRDRTFFIDAFRNTTPAVEPSSATLGSMGSLAQAIVEAVDTHRAAAPDAPLILNLSLGWDPRRFGTISRDIHRISLERKLHTVPALDVSPAVVHSALLYASCYGALVIAAAGNNDDGGCNEREALAPAMWEALPAPTPTQCKTLFGVEMPAATFSGPLVYAASGLHGDRMIPNARPGSRPRRLVAAFAAVAGLGNGVTDPWTGTSVAAAAVSGLAAMVWSHRPTLTSHQVMALLDASGQELDMAVQLPEQLSPPRARRLTGHAAYVAAGCKKPGCTDNPYVFRNNIVLEQSQSLPNRGTLSITTQTITDVAAIEAITPAVTTGKTLILGHDSETCGTPHYYPTLPKTKEINGIKLKTSSPPPPVDGYSLPWTRPQPETPICPYCPINNGTLFLSLNPKLALGTDVILQNPLLTITTPFGKFSVTLQGSITVPPAGKEVPLSAYRIVYKNVPTLVSDIVADPRIKDATLTVFVRDATGKEVGLVSVLEVLHPEG